MFVKSVNARQFVLGAGNQSEAIVKGLLPGTGLPKQTFQCNLCQRLACNQESVYKKPAGLLILEILELVQVRSVRHKWSSKFNTNLKTDKRVEVTLGSPQNRTKIALLSFQCLDKRIGWINGHVGRF